MITGVLLAVARISGETAPLLFTALNNQFFEPESQRADGEPAGGHLPVRAQPLRRLAAARLGRRAVITFAVLALNIVARTLAARGSMNAMNRRQYHRRTHVPMAARKSCQARDTRAI